MHKNKGHALQRNLAKRLYSDISGSVDSNKGPERDLRKNEILILNGQPNEIVEQNLLFRKQRRRRYLRSSWKDRSWTFHVA